jgi:hypothetical protein
MSWSGSCPIHTPSATLAITAQSTETWVQISSDAAIHHIRTRLRSSQNTNYYACFPISIVLPDVVSQFLAGRLSLIGSGTYRHVGPMGIARPISFSRDAPGSSTRSPADAIQKVFRVSLWVHIAAARCCKRNYRKSFPAPVREYGRHPMTNIARDREQIFDPRKIMSAGTLRRSRKFL